MQLARANGTIAWSQHLRASPNRIPGSSYCTFANAPAHVARAYLTRHLAARAPILPASMRCRISRDATVISISWELELARRLGGGPRISSALSNTHRIVHVLATARDSRRMASSSAPISRGRCSRGPSELITLKVPEREHHGANKHGSTALCLRLRLVPCAEGPRTQRLRNATAACLAQRRAA
jgi:hypothetical protein